MWIWIKCLGVGTHERRENVDLEKRLRIWWVGTFQFVWEGIEQHIKTQIKRDNANIFEELLNY